MKVNHLLTIGLALAALPFGAAAAETQSPAEPAKSVFNVPSSLREGRNPFYPNSTLGMQAAKPAPDSKAAAPEVFSIVLNGLSGPPRRTAIINGRTFEPGEQGEIRMPSGSKILVKCEEIRDDSAVIAVNGEKRLVRMRATL